MRRRSIVLISVGIGFVVAVPAAAYGYLAWTTRDAPERAALDPASEPRGANGPSQIDGTWAPVGVSTNFVGYRIRERVGPVPAPSDAVGRTDDVRGTATFTGRRLTQLELTADMALLRSDVSGRDDVLRDVALETARFPTAAFATDAPIELGAIRRGRVVEARVKGDLTLHGVTRSVVFDVDARWNGPTIQAAGTTTIRRDDFGIDVNSLGYSIAGSGTIEFELTLAPRGATVASPPSTLAERPFTPTPHHDDVPPCQSDGPAPPLGAPTVVTAFTPEAAVIVVPASGPAEIVATAPSRVAGAAWSPDASELVYASTAALEDPSSLAVVPAGGGTPRVLTGLGDAEQPDWSVDGVIAYVREDPDGNSDIWVVNADGSDAHRIVATPGVDNDPRWSPDGRRLAFTTEAGTDNQDVMIVTRSGRRLRALVSGRSYEYAPSFAPDGKTVLFVRDGSIHRIARDGRRERRLTRGPDDANPALSPDGTQLAFLRAGNLYVADGEGADARCVVTNELISYGPRWPRANLKGG